MKILDALGHLCAVVAIVYVARMRRAATGWESVPESEPDGTLPSLSIIVPARNEEDNIERCVRSLLVQRYPDVEIIVVNDRSTDATRAILTKLERESDRLRVIDGAPLVEGWTGKTWAMVQAASVARGSWLCFTDADTQHRPLMAASVVAFARSRGISVLSLGAHFELESFWERALMPTLLGLMLFFAPPPGRVNDPNARGAYTSGIFVLAERAAYEALGTHAAVRGEILEDIALGRLVKQDGRFRLFVAGGGTLVSVRMYPSFSAIWRGNVRNLFSGTRGNVSIVVLGFVVSSLLSYVPAIVVAVAIARRRPIAALEGVAAIASTIAVAGGFLGFLGLGRRFAVCAPLGIAIFSAMGLEIGTRMLLGRGVQWRGRPYYGKHRPDAT